MSFISFHSPAAPVHLYSLAEARKEVAAYGLTLHHNSFGDYVLNWANGDFTTARMCESPDEAVEVAIEMLCEEADAAMCATL